jgi:hypothetical protein
MAAVTQPQLTEELDSQENGAADSSVADQVIGIEKGAVTPDHKKKKTLWLVVALVIVGGFWLVSFIWAKLEQTPIAIETDSEAEAGQGEPVQTTTNINDEAAVGQVEPTHVPVIIGKIMQLGSWSLEKDPSFTLDSYFLAWTINTKEFAQTPAFSLHQPFALGEQVRFESATAQSELMLETLKKLLTENGYTLDPNRSWVNTSSGGYVDATIYSDGRDILTVETGKSLDEETMTLTVTQAVSAAELEKIEQAQRPALRAAAAGTYGQGDFAHLYDSLKIVERSTILEWDTSSSPVTTVDGEKRYLVVFDPHVSEYYFVYYAYNEATDQVTTIFKGLYDYSAEPEMVCADIQGDFDLSDGDRQFLEAKFCPN